VALLIFIAHIFTLTLLCATAFAYMAQVRTSHSSPTLYRRRNLNSTYYFLYFYINYNYYCLIIVVLLIDIAWQDWSTLVDNWSTPPINNVVSDIYFGYCSGLLGVTGFETSANYIEEQKDGVFPKAHARHARFLRLSGYGH
jgi:hypothetical protein